MRTITTTTEAYTLAELKDSDPIAYERALDSVRETQTDIPWAEEVCDSLRGLFDAAGIRLRNWSIGAYHCSSLSHDLDDDEADLSGPRAMAWLENRLLSHLRIPWTGPKRRELARYGRSYRPGMVKPCPFTGYFADDVFIDALRKSLIEGETVGDALEALADRAQAILEQEDEYQRSEEAIDESAAANEWEFDADGWML